MYVITGATGNIGKGISQILLSSGAKVRAIARDPERLQSLAAKGAEIRPGSLTDVPFLKEAFQGATGVFAMIPPDVHAKEMGQYMDQIGEAIASALSQAGVTHVVNLSSLGGDLPAGTGPIAGLYRQEQRLKALESVNVLHLRPSSFMENLLMNIPLIKQMGLNGSPLRADMAMPMVATRDIAAEAAQHLLKLDFIGHTVRYLLGPRDLTMTETTRILGKAIQKPDLTYVQFGYEDAEKGMVQAGLSPDVARSYIEMERAINEGKISPVNRTQENTTPTTLETFSDTFAAAYGRN